MRRYVLPYPPSANDYWRINKRGVVHETSEAKLYKQLAAALLPAAGSLTIDGTYGLHAEVYRPRSAGDLGNREKVLSDVLRGVAFTDDRHAVAILLTRHQAPDDLGFVVIEVREQQEEQPKLLGELDALTPAKRALFEQARLRLKAHGSERRNAAKRKRAARDLRQLATPSLFGGKR